MGTRRLTTRMSTQLKPNRFLSGGFAPVQEEKVLTDLKISGSLPESLRGGAYARNGPNPHFPSASGKYHWFDGDGMVHAVYFEKDGRATYRNKWVETEGFKYEKELGRGYFYGLADMKTMSDGVAMMFQSIKGAVGGILSPLGSLMGPSRYAKTTSNTALIFHHQRLLALVENGLPFELRAATLESVGPLSKVG